MLRVVWNEVLVILEARKNIWDGVKGLRGQTLGFPVRNSKEENVAAKENERQDKVRFEKIWRRESSYDMGNSVF